MSKLNIAHYIDNTEVEGPGRRFAIWVQGCFRRCAGCCNPELLEFIPQSIMESEQVAECITKSKKVNDIEGVTFLGGEPMLQARGLSEVARHCRTEGLSVMTSTGYTLSELKESGLPFVEELLRYTDLLVDGAYDRTKPENIRNWVGSANQRFHFLTDFYKSGIEYDERFSHGFELRVRNDGTLVVNGFPLQQDPTASHSISVK